MISGACPLQNGRAYRAGGVPPSPLAPVVPGFDAEARHPWGAR